ncbi:NAD-dependent epimerase/dehydratase family protein [Tamlana sp. 2201CG12-4]|uniref:NAD-dependent epimerase/dehydratase family protein n=1 Tax=Tamlana sp. 2201CG12-4 TaxID=3112582 RepID=UPI002DB8C6B3|nr:NAD-dependent epimerase/dehydratase family protein [Tamlana sp. 2201CG12-4]MEC3906624.1 NAD-dependent epimerase/dehydratase family protein [Tamlana sp. 2201CG12-4]
MILVTGGTGLVGAHLLYKLITQKENVRALYRSESKLANTKHVFSCYTKDYETLFNSIDWVKADILDVPALSEAFNQVTKVYHCAAFVSFEPDKYQLLRKTNIDGTANIVNIAISKKIDKLCYVSSIATLGDNLNHKPITEETNWNPEADNNVYAITKYGAEMEIWRGTQEGLNAVVVNPGVILGAGIWHYGTGSLFKKAHKGLKYYTQGTVALIAVEDVVAIMIELMHNNISNERFVLVAENWTYKRFLQALSKSVKTKPPIKLASINLLDIAWRLDWLKHKITRKRRLLTRHLVKSLTSETNYNSGKIKTAINHEFKAINKTITKVGHLYLKQD